MKLSLLIKAIVCFACVFWAVILTQRAFGQSAVNSATVTAILEGNQVFIQDRQARLRDTARRNQQVRTGTSRAELTFDNRAVARLSRNTRFVVGECGVQLERGTALISGTSGCTRGVTAAVRGTTFVMDVDENGVERYEVLEGTVEFAKTADSHRWSMSGGDQCIIRPDRPGVIRSRISRAEFSRRLRGWAFRGFETDRARFDRLRTTHARLFPNARFPLRTALSPNRGNFILSVRQERPQLREVIARISWQRKRLNAYLPERFVGDFVFPINQRAQFIRGVEAFDRFSVRLFDRQNRFLGYTEFEGLDDNAAVSIILPNDPNLYGTVRTVFGEDSDRDGTIDRDALTYDFVSLIRTEPQVPRERTEIIFPRELDNIDRSSLAVAAIPAPGDRPEFPDSFFEALFSPLNRSTFPFRSTLEAPILTVPGTVHPLVPVRPDGRSIFEIPTEILRHRRERLISLQD